MFKLIKDTYSGKKSFVDTMIFFGIFGISFFIILVFSLSKNYSYFLVTHKSIIYMIVALIMIYTVFLTLSLLRSSKNSKKTSLFAIAIEVIVFSLLTSYFVKTVYTPENIFESSILSLNKKLPMMISSDTRFNKVYIKDGDIYYDYTIINKSSSQINKDLFTLVTADKIQKLTAIDQLILKLSNKKRKISYVFKDKDENFITQVDIK